MKRLAYKMSNCSKLILAIYFITMTLTNWIVFFVIKDSDEEMVGFDLAMLLFVVKLIEFTVDIIVVISFLCLWKLFKRFSEEFLRKKNMSIQICLTTTLAIILSIFCIFDFVFFDLINPIMLFFEQ